MGLVAGGPPQNLTFLPSAAKKKVLGPPHAKSLVLQAQLDGA
jgi:hypothetical protein